MNTRLGGSATHASGPAVSMVLVSQTNVAAMMPASDR